MTSDVDPGNRQWIAGTRGQRIRLRTGINLTGATSLAVVIRPPESGLSAATVLSTGVTVDPTDPTFAVWTVTTANLDTPGIYAIRVRPTFSGGVIRTSEIPATLEVIVP